MPGTDLMPSGSKETFTGANGATPNTTNITLALNQGSGGGISIQGNQCRIRTGTTAFNRTSFRITGLSVADFEVEFDWIVPSGSVIFDTFMARSNSAIDGGTAYLFSLKPSDMNVTRQISYGGAGTLALVTQTHGFVIGDAVTTRIAIFGQRIRARTWLTANPEPTNTWQIDYTDLAGSGGITAAGSLGWSGSSASAGSKDTFFDNIDVHDTITPDQATLLASGSITPGGVLTKVPRKAFTGAITPSGALTRLKVVLRIFTGALTPAGALRKAGVKTLAGNVTPGGALRRGASKRMAGTVAPAALMRRTAGKRFAGSITPAGVGVVMAVGRIFGRPGQVIISLIERAEVRIRTRKG